MDWLYDDFVVGRQALSPSRAITTADVDAFALLTGDAHPLHTDAAFAAGTEFGERIAHGLLGLSVAAGLLHRLGIIGAGVMALVGIHDWQFLAPVRLGETVAAAVTVREARLSRRQPDRGIVTVEVEVRRGDAVVAQRGALTLLVRRQGEGA
ncbi:MAG: dehydratase [Chloroflexi bacterium]|nr:dehydratase [Chloroflexota bacterium]